MQIRRRVKIYSFVTGKTCECKKEKKGINKYIFDKKKNEKLRLYCWMVFV